MHNAPTIICTKLLELYIPVFNLFPQPAFKPRCLINKSVPAVVFTNAVPPLKILANYATQTVRMVLRVATINLLP